MLLYLQGRKEIKLLLIKLALLTELLFLIEIYVVVQILAHSLILFFLNLILRFLISFYFKKKNFF